MLLRTLKNTLRGEGSAEIIPFESLPDIPVLKPSFADRNSALRATERGVALTKTQITQDGLTAKERSRSGEDVVVAAFEAIAAGNLKPTAVREIIGLAGQVVLAGVERDRVEADVIMHRDTLGATIKAIQEDPNNRQTQALLEELKGRLGQAEQSAFTRYHQIQDLRNTGERAQRAHQGEIADRDATIGHLKDALMRVRTPFISNRSEDRDGVQPVVLSEPKN